MRKTSVEVLDSSFRRIALLGLLFVAAGCGSDRSVLLEGTCLGGECTQRPVTPEQARRSSRSIGAMWKKELRNRAAEDRTTRFSNVPPAELRERLDRAAAELDFDVVSFRLLEPRQLAPRIVVRTTHYLRLTKAFGVGGLSRQLDPHGGRDDRAGWSYEGFYFEAQDEYGVPFFIVHNYWRGGGGGGGQWARSERLFPFPHG